jgi:hypothetical protein
MSHNMWLTFNIVGSVICVLAVALMSSMFLGFMTLDPLDLRIKIRASIDSEEREHAALLLPIVENHHRLLVTLLLADAIFYETLPLFLDNLIPSWAAIVMSVTVLLVFGEIIPSAIFTGPEQLRLASQMTPLMNFFLWSLRPLAAPLIWLLDTLVPAEDEEAEAYNRGELSALVRIQYEDREETKRPAVNFTGLVPHTGQRKSGHQGSIPPRGPAVGPVKGKNNVLTVTDKSRGWRNLKREIMEAVELRYTDSHHQHPYFHSTASSTSSPAYHHQSSSERNHHHHHQYDHHRSHRRDRSTSVCSDHDSSIHSDSITPAYEQIAPPLHQAEVKMVEGALAMKTKVRAFAVKTKGRILPPPSPLSCLIFVVVRLHLISTSLLLLLLRLVCMGKFLWKTKMDFVGKNTMTRKCLHTNTIFDLRLFFRFRFLNRMSIHRCVGFSRYHTIWNWTVM